MSIGLAVVGAVVELARPQSSVDFGVAGCGEGDSDGSDVSEEGEGELKAAEGAR